MQRFSALSRDAPRWDSSHNGFVAPLWLPSHKASAYLSDKGGATASQGAGDGARGRRIVGQHLGVLPARRAWPSSTFGRRAVNDGKFVSRLSDGARITPETLERVSTFLTSQGVEAPAAPRELMPLLRVTRDTAPRRRSPPAAEGAPSRNFRFFDNRQKYLLFVNTCSEKEVVARRVGMELAHLHPEPPAVRVFDAGMGDGTVLTRVMREMHRRFPTLPFYVVGKEISLEDVRLSLDKMADRFHEHPATVLVVTNMYYTEAPWLAPKALSAATSLVWHEVALTGTTAAEFSEQIEALEPFLAKIWQAQPQPQDRQPHLRAPRCAGHLPRRLPLPARRRHPAPGPGARRLRPRHRLAALSRARARRASRRRKVIAPLTRALRPGGRLLGIHSCGRDPGLEIVRKMWPEEDPFKTSRHDILRAVRAELGRDARHYNFNAYADQRAVFRYDMHTLPTEIADASARPRCSPPGTPPSTWPDRRRAPGRGAGRAPLSRRHPRGAAGARAAVVPR